MRACLVGLLAAFALASGTVDPAAATETLGRARTILDVRRGAVRTQAAHEERLVTRGESVTIAAGRVHDHRVMTPASLPRKTILAVLVGSVTAQPRRPANARPLLVPAGHEAVFGAQEPTLAAINPARLLLARMLAEPASGPANASQLSAAVRASLSRLNAVAAERLRQRQASALRGLAVADCRIGSRALATLLEEFDEIERLTQAVDVAFRVADWKALGENGAEARYAAAVALSPRVAPDLRAEIAVAGTVRYRRLAGAWRFESFTLSHASVDTRKLPVAFDRLNDLLAP